MKKIISLIIASLGVLDILLWILNGFSYGWLELLFGINAFSKYGGWLMIVSGIWYYRRENALEKIEIDVIQELDGDDVILKKHISTVSILILTKFKLIYREYAVTPEMKENYNNVCSESKLVIPYNDIESVKTVTSREIAKKKVDKVLSSEFGISIVKKNGEIVVLASKKTSLIVAMINKNIN